MRNAAVVAATPRLCGAVVVATWRAAPLEAGDATEEGVDMIWGTNFADAARKLRLPEGRGPGARSAHAAATLGQMPEADSGQCLAVDGDLDEAAAMVAVLERMNDDDDAVARLHDIARPA